MDENIYSYIVFSYLRSKTHKRLKERFLIGRNRTARFVLFGPIKKRSFNLLCVLDLFFRTLAVNSVSDFFRSYDKSDFFFKANRCMSIFLVTVVCMTIAISMYIY